MLSQNILRIRIPILLFLFLVAGVYATAWFVFGRLSNLGNLNAVALGLTVDMVVTIPLAFYLLFIRRNGLSIIRLAPVVIASLLVASLVLPSDHQRALHLFEAAVAPIEVGLLGWIIWRATRALREARRIEGADPVEQFRSAAYGLLKNHRAARVFATEISVFFFALGSWRTKVHHPGGTTAFTHHQRSGQTGIVLGFVFLIVVEGIAVHLLLSMWNDIAAWIFTLSSIYGVLFLLSDHRAGILRPILVGDERVLIRGGLRYTADIPRSSISGISRTQPDSGKEVLNLKLIGSPTHWVEFTDVVDVQGPYGTKKSVRAIGLEPDDPVAFERELGE